MNIGKGSSAWKWLIPLFLLIAVIAFVLIRGLDFARSRPNVLWITMDSLRGDHLGCTGYTRAHTPNIDALAKEGTLFSEAISQSTYTRISVPSMITGKYPYFAGMRMMTPDLDSSHVTLAEALAAEGYFTYAIAEYWRPGFFQGLEKLHRESNSTIQKTQWCLEALENLDERPFFIWLYYWDPHAPYSPPVTTMKRYEADYVWEEEAPYSNPKQNASDEKLRDASGHYAGSIVLLLLLNRGQIVPTEGDQGHLVNLYDAEIAFVDAHIGEVVAKIKELDLWDNTMVVLNADHGEAFGEHGQYYHGYSIYEEEVHVPLIIKPPRCRSTGKAVDGPVRNLDIMPTILDYCDISPPADIQGRSLRPYMETDLRPHLPTCIETHRLQTQTHLLGYRDGQHKLIYNLADGGSQLYDLSTDHSEEHNLLAEGTDQRGRDVEAQLQKQLLDMLGVKAMAALKLGESPHLIDRQTQEQLKALGYIY